MAGRLTRCLCRSNSNWLGYVEGSCHLSNIDGLGLSLLSCLSFLIIVDGFENVLNEAFRMALDEVWEVGDGREGRTQGFGQGGGLGLGKMSLDL